MGSFLASRGGAIFAKSRAASASKTENFLSPKNNGRFQNITGTVQKSTHRRVKFTPISAFSSGTLENPSQRSRKLILI